MGGGAAWSALGQTIAPQLVAGSNYRIVEKDVANRSMVFATQDNSHRLRIEIQQTGAVEAYLDISLGSAIVEKMSRKKYQAVLDNIVANLVRP